MKKKSPCFIIFILVIASLWGCHYPFQEESVPLPNETDAIKKVITSESSITNATEPIEIETKIGTGIIPDGALSPDDLIYLGAFRLPDDSESIEWEYSGTGMTYFPEGEPQGGSDGFPGSLFIVGHDQRLNVAEINIPEPTLSRNLEDLNVAEVIQPFADITGGYLSRVPDIPIIGIAYLPVNGGRGTGQLHFTVGQHFQEFEPSHGWASLDLSAPNTAGLWGFNGYTNYVTNDYLFALPGDWAYEYAFGYGLATGRFREGVWGGLGPALFAYSPWEDGDPPASGQKLTTVLPLLLYGEQLEGMPDLRTDDSMRMDGYGEADHWLGGVWLTSSAGDAVIFSGTKAQGENWYGFANGVIWDYDCAENPAIECPEVPDFPNDDRGYWAEDYIPAFLFFNPADLAKVARAEIEPYVPQPYALMDLSTYWFDPEIDVEIYKRDLVGAVAFDRENGLLYIVERLADGYKSIIHVFRIGGILSD